MKSTRQAFGEKLAELGEKHQNVVVLDADLSKSTKSDLFAKRFPERFFQMGIAEANMIGTAAGLSFTGLIPFACSFGCFLTGRYDQIRLSVGYSAANVRLVGTHAGIGIGEDGVSQMGTEDVALMRAIPGMQVFQPMDAIEAERIVEALVSSIEGPAYLRLTRQDLPALSETSNAAFELGRILPVHIHAGARIALLGTGAGTTQAVQAAKLLESESMRVDVWNVHQLKPLDEVTLDEIAARYSLLVTVEDHSVIGGLGSAVAECMATRIGRSALLLRIGVQDVFAESAPAPLLYEKYGLSAEAIARQVAQAFAGLLLR